MAKGEVQSAGRKRRSPDRERIAQRLAKLCRAPGPCPEGVVRLNPGFFALEALRHANVAQSKARGKKRGKVKGK